MKKGEINKMCCLLQYNISLGYYCAGIGGGGEELGAQGFQTEGMTGVTLGKAIS
jgi:hypothetical protein